MIEVIKFINHIRNSEVPMNIRAMVKMLISYRKSISDWHRKRQFTVEAKKELTKLSKTLFIS